MTNYELSYLISPELSQSELEDFLKKIESLVSKTGKILKSENPKKTKLSYPIQKKKQAFLNVFEFQAEKEKIDNLKKEIEKEKNILRYLLIKKVERPAFAKGTSTELGRSPTAGKEEKLKKEKLKKEKKVELKEIEEKLGKILE